VLRPGGRLVAATNGIDHLAELWALVGRDRRTEHGHFYAEDAAAALERHFAAVERRDFEGTVTFDTADHVRGYIGASVAHKHLAERVPPFDGPLVARQVNAVFVAHK
jgi:hypothetical protein